MHSIKFETMLFVDKLCIMVNMSFKALGENTRLLEDRLGRQSPVEVKIEKEVTKLREKLETLNLELDRVSHVAVVFHIYIKENLLLASKDIEKGLNVHRLMNSQIKLMTL